HLPRIVAGADVLSGGASTVRVPVRMLEHYRFRLRNSNEQQGVGQGQAKPGDRIGRPQQEGEQQRGQGGNEDGTIQYTLEFRIDDIVDWLDRKSTRLNSSHVKISYAVFCLKKKKTS